METYITTIRTLWTEILGPLDPEGKDSCSNKHGLGKCFVARVKLKAALINDRMPSAHLQSRHRSCDDDSFICGTGLAPVFSRFRCSFSCQA